MAYRRLGGSAYRRVAAESREPHPNKGTLASSPNAMTGRSRANVNCLVAQDLALLTKVRTLIHKEISLLTVLYFPFRARTPKLPGKQLSLVFRSGSKR